jgi:hypothetical protein
MLPSYPSSSSIATLERHLEVFNKNLALEKPSLHILNVLTLLIGYDADLVQRHVIQRFVEQLHLWPAPSVGGEKRTRDLYATLAKVLR